TSTYSGRWRVGTMTVKDASDMSRRGAPRSVGWGSSSVYGHVQEGRDDPRRSGAVVVLDDVGRAGSGRGPRLVAGLGHQAPEPRFARLRRDLDDGRLGAGDPGADRVADLGGHHPSRSHGLTGERAIQTHAELVDDDVGGADRRRGLSAVQADDAPILDEPLVVQPAEDRFDDLGPLEEVVARRVEDDRTLALQRR